MSEVGQAMAAWDIATKRAKALKRDLMARGGRGEAIAPEEYAALRSAEEAERAAGRQYEIIATALKRERDAALGVDRRGIGQ